MRAKIALLLSVSLLTGVTAATAQPLPCASVAPEVRERVREAGACRDDTPATAAPKAASMPSDTITMKLPDGTVVRIPREISSSINDGRKHPATHETAPPKSAPPASASAQSKPGARDVPVPASPRLEVPDLVGRSYANASGALAEFRVDRIEAASAASAGEVLAQDPAPATLVPREARSACRCRTFAAGAAVRHCRCRPAPAPEPTVSLRHSADFGSRFRPTLRSFSARACCSVCCSALC